MSGLLSPAAVHERTQSNLAEWARSNERSYDEAAAILGLSHGSTFRRISGVERTDWSVKDLVRAACHAERIEGDHRILNELIADIRGADIRPGDATGAVTSAANLVAFLGAEIARIMGRIGDGRFDQTEARETLEDIVAMRRLLDDLQAKVAGMLS